MEFEAEPGISLLARRLPSFPGVRRGGDGESDITEIDITESAITNFQESDITESDITEKGNCYNGI